ncbi:tyrosine-protein phosphatase [Phenylobacterium sp.]|uniref:tyrosine-protein phosphatase n=1 Tax=Phenylobacterium sp. TaxID=1871053 RepID=UPI002732510D|nr:tyrosine-protein phosphatase [Phenylobacterium sp.]MDP3660992.1 tyrosine-protein phosphatase [Phenylobacterium sp.]
MPDAATGATGPAQDLRLACAPNFRDLAAQVHDLPMRRGMVYRSDMVFAPSENEAECLHALGVRVVFDLRSAAESAASPNAFWRDHGVEVLDFDIGSDVRAKGSVWDVLKDDASAAAIHALLSRIYQSIPAASAPALRSLFERIAAGDAPVMIHCSAGKDRTGFVSAMLLSALGASRETIEADYLASGGRTTPERLAYAHAMVSEVAGGPLEDDASALLTGVHLDFLDNAFGWIERKFGTTQAFLEQVAGLDEERRRQVRSRLIEA